MSFEIKFRIGLHNFNVIINGVAQNDKQLNGFKKHSRNALVNLMELAKLLNETIPNSNNFEILIRDNHSSPASYNFRNKKITLDLATYKDNSITREQTIFHELVHYLEDNRFARNYPAYTSFLSEGFAEYFTYIFYNDTNSTVRRIIQFRFEMDYSIIYAVGFFYTGYLFKRNRNNFDLFLIKNPSDKICIKQEKILKLLNEKEPIWFMKLLKENTDFGIRGINKIHYFIYRFKEMSEPLIYTLSCVQRKHIKRIPYNVPLRKSKIFKRLKHLKPDTCRTVIKKLYNAVSHEYAYSMKHYPDFKDKIYGEFKMVEP